MFLSGLALRMSVRVLNCVLDGTRTPDQVETRPFFLMESFGRPNMYLMCGLMLKRGIYLSNLTRF